MIDIRFPLGACHLLVGPSGSGKTYRTIELLRNKNDMFKNGKQVKNVVFCFAAPQKIYEEVEQENIVTRWVNKMPTNDEFITLVSDYKDDGGSIVVIDDFMSNINKDLVEIVTVTSRHMNTSTLILFQSLFPPNPLARQISLNVKYIHIHKNPRENAQIQYLARQLRPTDFKWIVEAYHTATKNPYSCFLIDLNQESDERVRFLSNILPSEHPIRAWFSTKNATI